MAKIRLGEAECISSMPIYHALEESPLSLEAHLIKASQDKLNEMFLTGKLDVSLISAMEYAKYANQCYLLPNISVSTDGKEGSVFLFSEVPVTELEKKCVVLSAESTERALLKILLDHYYHVDVEYHDTKSTDLEQMLKEADAALLAGDAAMLINQQVKKQNLPYVVTDLCAAWTEFTGEKMVFAVWAVQKEFAENNFDEVNKVSQVLQHSKSLALQQMSTVLEVARRNSNLPLPLLEEYYQHIYYDFDESYRRALITFFDYAYKSGLIKERVRLNVWDEKKESTNSI